jgi:hypothetical protein
MKSPLIKLAVLSALGFASPQVFALGLEPLVAAPTGSAYIDCYNANRVIPSGGVANNVKGNFGSFPIAGANLPSTTVNNTCFVAKPTNEATAPISGYTSIASRTTDIPTATGAGGKIGTIVDRVWRDTATSTMCIFGTRVTMINADHDSSAGGTQLFEVNDIARGGFSSAGTVNVGYTIFSTAGTTSPIFRIGRTFTSVQHRALKYDTNANKEQNGTGYLDLPTIGGSSTLAINGNDTVTISGLPFTSTDTASVTAASEQDAQVNSNWVDFNADAVYTDDDGSTNALSGYTYIQAACDATDPNDVTNPWIKTGAIRLRQTAQENAKFKEISIDGYAPPGATVP